MSNEYLIPQFIIDFLQKSRSTKNPQKLAGVLINKNKTPKIEQWFKDNKVTTRFIWVFFVSQGKNKFHFKTCAVCGKRIKLETLLSKPDAKYCSYKCCANSKEFKEKIKQTCLEKYGVENPFQAKVCKEKSKRTNLEKYGVEYHSQSKEYKHTHRSNYWETFCSNLKEKKIIPLFTKEDYINDIGRKFKCLSCNEEFESEGICNYKKKHKNKDGTNSTLISSDIRCPHCLKAPFSKKEKEVLEFVRNIYDGEIEENNRTVLYEKNKWGRQLEIDIYLPQLNIGIEFDGDYWHSFNAVKENDFKKNQLCEQKGIRLLRIKELEWDNNPEKAKEEIQSFLNLK